MSHPSLALCIPAYNATAYLPRLLESALAQTISFDEIWVYDDCSTDETGKVAAEFEAKVIRGEINRGCSHGKNILAEHTTCEWIHFHDADDALYPNFVEQARKWMVLDNSPDVVLFNYECRRDDTGELIGIRQFDDAELRRDAIAYTIREQINPFCGLYRRSAYLQAGGYDTDPLVLYNEDVAFHCRMAIAGLKFAADSTVTIINYCRANSMSAANQIKCTKAQFHVMRKVAESLNGKYSHEIAQKLWGIAGVAAAYLDWEIADNCVDLAISIHHETPNNLSALFRFLCSFNPYFAIRVRERLIRFLKPQLRQQITT
ncbi:glycosyltransferase family 2 protein [Fortiea sp. LEGE XX443]|uniref:glycosyltransferase family 2 protein n=1 Tax=Fortiea sp. LEGE XX443 TaxID=1828611 RepID=UPI001881C6E7|nr:glycosyltransferase family 2 protein [Fortiea sp. LEGE XX443]MBE9005329.1 glycosyltransferase family 2 protein [Fortiea sp. LEGE XX443]